MKWIRVTVLDGRGDGTWVDTVDSEGFPRAVIVLDDSRVIWCSPSEFTVHNVNGIKARALL